MTKNCRLLFILACCEEITKKTDKIITDTKCDWEKDEKQGE